MMILFIRETWIDMGNVVYHSSDVDMLVVLSMQSK